MLLGSAGAFWAIAGMVLGFRGCQFLDQTHLPLFLALGVTAGVAFFFGVFRRIASRYIQRIRNLPSERPCFFSLFSVRGYAIMAFMISFGILLRTTDVLPRNILGTLYVTIAVALVTSSFLFFRGSIVTPPDSPTSQEKSPS